MKKILLFIPALVIILAACNTDKKTGLDIDKNIVFTDTSLLKNANASTDVANNLVQPEEVAAPSAKPKVEVRTITKVVRVVEKQPTPTPVQQAAPPVVTPAETPVATAPAPSTNSLPGETQTGSGDAASVPTTPVETKKKNTGWSQAAKGATIGGVGGAVAGAVIGKGGKGAIIGGVIGAAGGYILGRSADKKSGRIEYSN